MAIFLADDFPRVGPFHGDCESGPEAAALVRAVGHDSLGSASAKIKGVLVRPGCLNFHLVGKSAFGWVELPFAYQGIIHCR